MSVVLDMEYTDVLLGMAASEGLLEVKRAKGLKDRHWVDSVTNYRTDLRASLLATIVADNEVLLPTTQPYFVQPGDVQQAIEGALFDRLKISFLTPEEEKQFGLIDEDPLPLFSSQASLVAYLNACGMTLTVERLEQVLRENDELLNEYERRFGERPSWEIKIIEDIILRRLSEEERQFLSAYDTHCQIITSFSHHISSLNHQIKRANKLGANILLSKPLGVRQGGSFSTRLWDLTELPNVDTNKLNQSELFRFVAMNIGTYPYKPTLAESLTLAKTKEAEALRVYSRQLFDDIHAGRTMDFQRLKKEIDLATKSLHWSEGWSKVSDFMTTVGVPISLLGMVSNDASLAGIGISLLGAYALGNAWLGKAEAGRWVKFGKS